jgi:hypothetical protein
MIQAGLLGWEHWETFATVNSIGGALLVVGAGVAATGIPRHGRPSRRGADSDSGSSGGSMFMLGGSGGGGGGGGSSKYNFTLLNTLFEREVDHFKEVVPSLDVE